MQSNIKYSTVHLPLQVSQRPPLPATASCHVQFGSLVQEDATHTKPLTLLRYTLPYILAESDVT